jgi:hypothetical protein
MQVSKSINSTRLLEDDIKAATIDYLKNKNLISTADSIISEFTVEMNTRRADLAIVRSKDIWAVEVKSEFDSLSRLRGQTEKYLEYFDKVIVVCSPKHTNRVLDLVACGVAVYEILNKESIKVVRRGRKKQISSKSNMLKMMNRPELSKLASKHQYSMKNRSRNNLENFLESIPNDVIRSAVFEYLRDKYKYTSTAFWNLASERSVTTDMIHKLSLTRILEDLKIKNTKDNLSWLELSVS